LSIIWLQASVSSIESQNNVSDLLFRENDSGSYIITREYE